MLHIRSQPTSAERRELTRRMLHYYQSEHQYHTNVGDIAGARPSDEEWELFKRLPPLLRGISKPKILELGCGRCESAAALLQLFDHATYSGVEASPDAVAVAKSAHPTWDVAVGDISKLTFEPNSFDLVLMNYVLEHTADPRLVLEESFRVLRSGGLVALIVPVGDLPWALPSSLRYERRNPLFLAAFTVRRWLEAVRLRWSPTYFAFPVVTDPIVLKQPGAPFQPDDDLIYAARSLEIEKYLRLLGAKIEGVWGRDIRPYIQGGHRPAVDAARSLAFAAYRATLGDLDFSRYTTTVSIVVRKP